ncbi:MAG: DUF4214 domain-containing protein, partial [Lachnospiraceae bacterium]|nr:DUF4214 domain-containing protein [Lachnospiraceae bacterium]
MKLKRLLLFILTITLLLGATTSAYAAQDVPDTVAAPDETETETEAPERNQKVVNFVTRLYQLMLSREPDPNGLTDWYDSLVNNEKTAAEVIRGFAYSPEFQKKNLSDEDYVEIMYNTLLGRASDPSGKEHWLGLLADGVSRRLIISRFIASKEFTKYCDNNGITRGSLDLTEARDVNVNVTRFVGRFYTIVLGRKYDIDGLNDWCGRLNSHTASGSDIAFGFLLSSEFVKKNYSDPDFLEILYNTLMGRASDKAGKDDWMQKLAEGHSREWVIRQFIHSKEFKEICAKYKITVGDANRDRLRDKNWDIAVYVSDVYKNAFGRKATGTELDKEINTIINNKETLSAFLTRILNSKESKVYDESGNFKGNYNFLQVAYKVVLQREADTDGLNKYLAMLNQGTLRSKIISDLCASDE